MAQISPDLRSSQLRWLGSRSQLRNKKSQVSQNVIERLSGDEEQKLIACVYRENSTFGLFVKILFLTGDRVSEFVARKVEDFYFDEQMTLIKNGKEC